MGNFTFLKNIDKRLFEIISDAEKLYRDEYFEQSITQTRRFAENVCKQVLGSKRTTERTFDDMLATLKDNATKSIQEKEFVEDLYFIKREGNNTVHSSKVKQDGIIALECLQRAFEVAISYCVYYQNAKNTLLKRQFDTELLVTGKKTKKTLAEKYEEEKTKNIKPKKESVGSKKSETKIKSVQKRFSMFKIIFPIFAIVSIALVIMIFILSII